MTCRRCLQGLLKVPNLNYLFLANLFLNLLNYFLLVGNRHGLDFLQSSLS